MPNTNITNPETLFVFEVEGEKITGKVLHDGQFSYIPSTLFGTRLSGSPERVRKDVVHAAAEQREKAARTKRLAEAASNPEPAEFQYMKDGEPVFEKIGVRGTHKTSSDALIVRATGEKQQLRRSDVLRPLAGEERDALAALLREEVAVRAAAPTGTEYGVAQRALNITFDLTFDTEDLVYRFEFEGEKYVAETAYEARSKIGEEISRRLVERDYPYTVSDGRVAPTSEVNRTWGRVFKSKDDAEAALAAEVKIAEIRQQIKEMLVTLQFDFSVLTDTFADGTPRS